MTQLAAGSGPYYERWRRRVAARIGAVIVADGIELDLS